MRSGTRRSGQPPAGVEALPRLSPLLAVGCVTVLLTAGCTGTGAGDGLATRSSSSNAPTASAAESCPVTQPTGGDVPTGVSEQEPGNVFGHGGLWVAAWWTDPTALGHAGMGGRHKYKTWTVRDGEVTRTSGSPRITVKRVDGPGHGQGNVGGFAMGRLRDGTAAYWWPTVVTFSGSGCWQVTETAGDDSITYTVKI